VLNVPLGLWYRWRQRHGDSAAAEAAIFRRSRRWAQSLFRRMHVQVEVEGLEHVPAAGPLVVMTNHQSMWDIPLLMGYLGRTVGFVAKRELFRLPAFAFWMRLIHSVPLDRSDPRAGARMMDSLAADMKQHGYAMVVFPEGTRSRHPDGELGPFRRGSLRLATTNDLPILPVSIEGTRFLSDMQALARTRRGGRVVRLKVAPPVLVSHQSSLQAKAFAEELRATIENNRNTIRLTWPAQARTEPDPDAPAAAALPTSAKSS
jgi:1-acyl-sn-glycerol-3-phosphate acyltransferase